ILLILLFLLQRLTPSPLYLKGNERLSSQPPNELVLDCRGIEIRSIQQRRYRVEFQLRHTLVIRSLLGMECVACERFHQVCWGMGPSKKICLDPWVSRVV